MVGIRVQLELGRSIFRRPLEMHWPRLEPQHSLGPVGGQSFVANGPAAQKKVQVLGVAQDDGWALSRRVGSPRQGDAGL